MSITGLLSVKATSQFEIFQERRTLATMRCSNRLRSDFPSRAFSVASTEEMLTSLLGDNDGLAALKRLIIEKTERTPFFMEEMVQVLLDDGSLVRNGTAKLTRPLAELKIPPTVQAILASRIDRLPPDAKDLLQTLAVSGREFPASLVRAVAAKSDDEVNRTLNDLQVGEFIYEQPAVGDVEYTLRLSRRARAQLCALARSRGASCQDRAWGLQ